MIYLLQAKYLDHKMAFLHLNHLQEFFPQFLCNTPLCNLLLNRQQYQYTMENIELPSFKEDTWNCTKYTSYLIIRIKQFVENRCVASMLLVSQKLHFITQWQTKKPFALSKNLVHEFLRYSMIHSVKESGIQTGLHESKTSSITNQSSNSISIHKHKTKIENQLILSSNCRQPV